MAAHYSYGEMSKPAHLATTRTATVPRLPRASRVRLLVNGEAVASPETGLRYEITDLVGEGGFGQVYLANRLGKSQTVPDVLCIKASTRKDAWLREAYFGQLLDGHPRCRICSSASSRRIRARCGCTTCFRCSAI